jgi:hypothetical protein
MRPRLELPPEVSQEWTPSPAYDKLFSHDSPRTHLAAHPVSAIIVSGILVAGRSYTSLNDALASREGQAAGLRARGGSRARDGRWRREPTLSGSTALYAPAATERASAALISLRSGPWGVL